ncbi:MAG: glycosyltransferase [Candidatus Omnitrophica bacterium]|nr:glycosyltransferase [Candidatus Omnitrophota bacterium]
MNIILAAERSAGHIFPALTIASAMIKDGKKGQSSQDKNVFIFTTSSKLKKYVEEEGFTAIGRCFSKRNILIEGFWRFFESFYIIFKLRPGLVIGFGGRDSFFLVFISSLLFIKTFIYEPNVTFGRANKKLAWFVSGIWRGMVEDGLKKKEKSIGIPLRKGLLKLEKEQARKSLGFDERPVIFCFGGSQGSVFINDIFMRFVKNVSESIQIIHLTGPDQDFQISRFYNKISNNKFIRDFYYQIGTLYSAADLLLCRAGALTLGEISYFNLPSVLVPYPSSGGHQKENALFFKKHEAAIVIEQDGFDFESFAVTLNEVLYDRCKQQKLIDNLQKIRLGVSFEDFQLPFDF